MRTKKEDNEIWTRRQINKKGLVIQELKKCGKKWKYFK